MCRIPCLASASGVGDGLPVSSLPRGDLDAPVWIGILAKMLDRSQFVWGVVTRLLEAQR